MLNDTIEILEKGYYITDAGKRVNLKLSKQQMMACTVYMPEQLHEMGKNQNVSHAHIIGRMGVSCENVDSFSLAQKRAKNASIVLSNQKEQRVLVLNLANPFHPGGGVRRGANAQEEDLCRKSSLLLSLEGRKAKAYYDYNASLHSYMSSDALIITPNVEIIKDEAGRLLDETTVVSVMTCAAPMLFNGMGGMTQEQYEQLVYKRITGMLNVAAFLGYKLLVLGAFGCGAFKNDAHVVSDLYYRALKNFKYEGMSAKDMFYRVDFAVLDRTADQYNYKEFSRNFN